MKRIAVVTGGAAGIGKCLVKTLAEKGMIYHNDHCWKLGES